MIGLWWIYKPTIGASHRWSDPWLSLVYILGMNEITTQAKIRCNYVDDMMTHKPTHQECYVLEPGIKGRDK